MKSFPNLLWLCLFVLGSMAYVPCLHAQDREEPKLHPLEVFNGTGDGEYEYGTEVTITAQPTLNGAAFVMWRRVGNSPILVAKPYDISTTVKTSYKASQIAAVYAHIDAWCPDWKQIEPTNSESDQYYGPSVPKPLPAAPPDLSALPPVTTPRKEMKIRLKLELGEAPEALASEITFDLMHTKLRWFPTTVSQDSWHSNHLKFYKSKTGDDEIRQSSPTSNTLYFDQDTKVDLVTRIRSVWYFGDWTYEDLAPRTPEEEPRNPPVFDVGTDLHVGNGKTSLHRVRQSKVTLLPVDINGYNRGTINAPGERVPRGIGEYGQETVMLENGDSESAENSTEPDYTLGGNLNEHRMENDDDFVKVVLRWPKDVKIEGARLELHPRGLEMDPRETEDVSRYVENDTPRLNFFKPDGTRLSEADLLIENLGSPGNGYLAEILDTGELTLFVEGAERFGSIDPYLAPRNGHHVQNSETLTQARDAAQKLGGSILNYEFTNDGATSRTRLLIYRGGYLHFRMPTTTPPLPTRGVLGTLEFRDGKGRASAAEVDEGNVLFSWAARSGRVNGEAYNVNKGGGHTPPGWYLTYQRTDITSSQRDQHNGTGQKKRIRQGSYVRWSQDDETDQDLRYTTSYRYNAEHLKDRNIGEPTAIRFKWQMEVIPPTSPANRDQIQIHPDGRQDGTSGCVGILHYSDCLQIDEILSNFHGLKLFVELE